MMVWHCFYSWKAIETTLNIHLDSVKITKYYKQSKIKIILNLLNKACNSKCVTRKWNVVNDHLNANYYIGNEIIYNTEVLMSHLCCYNGTHILVRGDTITKACNNPTQVIFKYYTPFIKYVVKVVEATIDDAED